MYLDEKHNILILEDKDYDSRHDIKSFLFLINTTIKSLNIPHNQKFLIKADLTKIKNIDKDYLDNLSDKSYLYNYYYDVDEQLRVLCPNCLSNKFESLRKIFIPMSIDDDSLAIVEEDVKEGYMEESSYSFKISCDCCGNVYEPPKE